VYEYVEGGEGGKAGGGHDDSLSPSLAVCALAELSFLYQEDEDLVNSYDHERYDLSHILQKYLDTEKVS
jgi:hypothetical protein